MNTASPIWGIQWNRSKDSCRIHTHSSTKQELIWHTHTNTSQTHTHTCQTHTQLSNTASILSRRVRWCGGHDKVLSVLLELTSRSYSRFFFLSPSLVFYLSMHHPHSFSIFQQISLWLSGLLNLHLSAGLFLLSFFFFKLTNSILVLAQYLEISWTHSSRGSLIL